MMSHLDPNVRKGWIQALFSVLILWGLVNVSFRYVSIVLDANFFLCTSATFAGAAFVLVAYGGHGNLIKETIRSTETWAYGFIVFASQIITLVLFSFVTATEGTLLQRLTLIISLLMSFYFFGRKPNRNQAIGIFLVFIGFCSVYLSLESNQDKSLVLIITILHACVQAVRVFISELHKPHQAAAAMKNDPHARARVIGFVMFVVSTIFLVLLLIAAWWQSSIPIENRIDVVPTFSELIHAPSIISGLIIGVVLISPVLLIEFSSSSIIKTESYLAVSALAPVSTFFWEWIFSLFTNLSVTNISNATLASGLLIVAGAIIAAISKISAKQNIVEDWQDTLSYQPQDPFAVADTREIIMSTLEYTDFDMAKAKKLLDIPIASLRAVMDDKEEVLAFKPEKMIRVARNYRKNVTMFDGLTGLFNREAFMTQLRAATYEAQSFSLMFIDLNDFKPVNDTYGHDAGDEVLKNIGERLNNLFPKKSVVTRLGGDEFCVLLLNVNRKQADKLSQRITDKIEEPIKLAGIKKKIHVSCSVGIVSYPEDAENSKQLLKLADAYMYKIKKANKKSR